VLSLASTRIHGFTHTSATHETLLRRLERVNFLDMAGTPFASIDSKKFFDSIETHLLQRLVWIPKTWLTGRAWVTMIPQDARQRLVIDTHYRYYASVTDVQSSILTSTVPSGRKRATVALTRKNGLLHLSGDITTTLTKQNTGVHGGTTMSLSFLVPGYLVLEVSHPQ
jgi:hypothetical protein